MPSETHNGGWVGRVVHDRYEVLRPIARGSMGSVYLARHQALDREVALKVLDVNRAKHISDSRSDDKERKRFLREAALLAKLTHPNTVRVFDFGIEDDTPFIVMEYIRGDTLQQLLKKAPRMEPERAFRLARQVCSSLREAHDLGLVHRDLKPANILLTTDFDGSDMIKVVDFGLVKEVRDAVQMTGDGVMVGTPMYMAPEQIRGKALDQRVDIYALGVILYKLLLGRPPFVESQTAALLVAHITDPVPAFKDIDPALQLPVSVEYTVRKCLEKEPDERFGDSTLLLRALKVCEASILDATIASSAQWDLLDGRRPLPPELDTATTDVVDQRMVEHARRRRRNQRIQWVLGGTLAMLVALAFGFVGVRAVVALSGSSGAQIAAGNGPTEDTPPALPAHPEPSPPVPAPGPATVEESPPSNEDTAEQNNVEPADDEEVAPPAARAPKAATRPRPEPTPKPMPAPAPATEAKTAPKPVPAPASAPAPKTAPEPKIAPEPAPTPSNRGIGGSDLTDPWSNGDAQ